MKTNENPNLYLLPKKMCALGGEGTILANPNPTMSQLKDSSNRPRTISPPPPAIEISTPREIIVTFPHPPLFPHHGYCLGVDVKPSSHLSWGTHASPPWGSRSCSLLTPAHEVRFSPLPRTCFAPRLAFCTVGKLLASFTVGDMASGLSVEVRLRFCWACTSDGESFG